MGLPPMQTGKIIEEVHPLKQGLKPKLSNVEAPRIKPLKRYIH